MDNNMQDKVVVLTGASSGIGKSLAGKLAHMGAKPVLVNNAGVMPASFLEMNWFYRVGNRIRAGNHNALAPVRPEYCGKNGKHQIPPAYLSLE